MQLRGNEMESLKEELEGYLRKMIEPLKGKYSAEKSGIDLGAAGAGYGLEIARMEGLNRVLWGLTPYWTGGGEDRELVEYCRRALILGTDPKSPEYWGDLGNSDQRMVEMAAISLNFLMSPQVIWNSLKAEEQDKVAAWLYQINNYTQPDNNWNYFCVITNVALKHCKKPYSQERMDYGIDRYEKFYLGNGWYSDGLRPQKDYYISFGIHFYNLIYARFMEADDPKRCRIYKERAKSFAETFLYWFDGEGKALPFGRSMTYRFAQVAFFSIFAVVVGEECSYLGIIKGIIARNFRYWMRQPIFDNGGVLTIGYSYPNLNLSETYNSPGSPYWAFKAFYCLSLPAEHTFWAIKEEPLPRLKQIKQIVECNMLIQQRTGEVVALTAGQYPTVEHTHSPAKYAKFAYSSRFGFSVPRSSLFLEENAPDSMLAFRFHDMIYVRRECLAYEIFEHQVYARWSPFEGITVETTLIPTEKGHIRKHRIHSKWDCAAYDCGFAYPSGKLSKAEVYKEYACVCDNNGYSRIDSCNGNGKLINAAPNTNLIFPLTKIPAIEYEIKSGIQEFQSAVSTDMKKGHMVTGRGDCYELLSE